MADTRLEEMAREWRDAVEARYGRYPGQHPGVMDLLLEFGRQVQREERERCAEIVRQYRMDCNPTQETGCDEILRRIEDVPHGR